MQVEDPHHQRLTPEDSSAEYLKHVYLHDSLSPRLRTSLRDVTPQFIQKVAYTTNDLELILSRGDADRAGNIDFLYFTAHASAGSFEFYSATRSNGNVKKVRRSASTVLQALCHSDVKNLVVSGCEFLPNSSQQRYNLLRRVSTNWSGRLLVAMSAPSEIGTLLNRDILQILTTIFCVVFDRYVYMPRSGTSKDIGLEIRRRLEKVYSTAFLKRCGVCILWKPPRSRHFLYWDHAGVLD
jgi:hypothetical protein